MTTGFAKACHTMQEYRGFANQQSTRALHLLTATSLLNMQGKPRQNTPAELLKDSDANLQEMLLLCLNFLERPRQNMPVAC